MVYCNSASFCYNYCICIYTYIPCLNRLKRRKNQKKVKRLLRLVLCELFEFEFGLSVTAISPCMYPLLL